MKLPFAVKIDGRTYNVESITRSGSRGEEYELSELDHGGTICRVCHAPPRIVKSARTGGETIEYFWAPNFERGMR